MINAVSNSSTPSGLGGSPMPPKDLPSAETTASTASTSGVPSTPATVTKSVEPTQPATTTPTTVPPQVLPSHGTLPTQAARPLHAPHQDIASLHKTLADKVNTQSTTPTGLTDSGSSTPPTPPASDTPPTVDTPVAPPSQKKSGMSAKLLVGIGLFVLTLIGGGAAYYLQSQNQDTRQQASYFQWEGKVGTTGLEIDVPDKSKFEKGYLNSGQYSGYKPASSNVSDPNAYYDVSKGESVNFSVPLKNTHEEARGSKYRFFVYKINEANEGGQWKSVNEDWNKSEEEMYNIHNADKNNPSTGTRQSQVYDGGWQSFSIPSGQSGKIEGSWKPGNNDCGVYQIDIFVDNGSGDASLSDMNNIVGAGFIRVKGCTAPTQASCNMIEVADTITLGGSVTVKLTGTAINTYDLYYAPVQENYCATTVWKPVATGVASGEFTWNTAGLAAGKYIISGIAHGADGFHCSSNPSGSCGTEFKECKQCGKEVTIVTPETPGACNSITAPDSVTVGDKVTVKVNGTNLVTSKLYYSPQKANYCAENGVNPWTEITTDIATKGEFVWDTAGLAPGSYYLSANAQLSSSRWCSANPSGACGTTFEECKQCGKAITVKAPPTAPPGVGGMCVNLCGVFSDQSSLTEFAGCPGTNGKVGTPNFNGYVNFKCSYSGTVAKVAISVSKDGGAYQELTTSFNPQGFYAATYQLAAAGNYAARCDVTPAEPGTYTPPQTQVPPTGTQTACPISDTANYSCVSDITACASIGEVEMISLPGTGQAVPKYACSNASQICCKKDPNKNPTNAPKCTSLPATSGGSPRCILPSITSCNGETRSDADCSEIAGSVCCVPAAVTTTGPVDNTGGPLVPLCTQAGGTCQSRCDAAQGQSQINATGCAGVGGQSMVCCSGATSDM